MKVNQRKSPQISKKIKGAVRPIKIIYNPNALDVITGFPEGEEIALEKRAVLDPEQIRKNK